MKTIITQIIANLSYTDAKIVFCYNGEKNNSYYWDFLKILPHTWSENRKFRYFATNKQEASDVFFEVSNILRTRSENKDEYNKSNSFKPHYFLFVLNGTLLDGEIISKYILDLNNDLGITTFLVAENFRELPSSCINIIQKTKIVAVTIILLIRLIISRISHSIM